MINTMKRAKLIEIMDIILTGNLEQLSEFCKRYSRRMKKGCHRSWSYNLNKFAKFVDSVVDGNIRAGWQVFKAEGNVKLKFLTFSSLSGYGFCPGMGSCAKWCFTLKSWRYPAAFFRQAQNTILLQTPKGREYIRQQMLAINAKAAKKGVIVDFRLHVDGDFETAEIFAFWMSLFVECPHIAAYGYSKSFAEILAFVDSGGVFAPNYVLNLSSGHNHTASTVDRIKALPIVRGNFSALGSKGSSVYGTKEYNKKVREAAAELGLDKVFPCPGKCNTCTPKGHACGSKQFNGIDIVILAH